MSTRQFTFETLITSLSSANDTKRFDQAIQFSSFKSTKKLKLVNCYISGAIPNIYNYGGVNNGLIRVSNDGGSTWTSVQLENGEYTTLNIASALNYSISSWITDLSDPPITISTNDVVGKVYTSLDSTKLSTGSQIAIDYSQSLIYDVLGYDVGTSTFTTDGLHSAPNLAKLDTFGNTMSVNIYGFGDISVVNNASTNSIARVNLTNKVGNLYYLDTASFFPITIFPPSQIQQYSIEFKGSRQNTNGTYKDILFLEGEICLTFQLVEM